MDIIEFSLNSLHFLFYKLKNTLIELETFYYYTKDYRFLIIKLLSYVEDIEKKFEDLRKKVLNELGSNDSFEIFKIARDRIRSISLKLKYFHRSIELLKSAKDFFIHQSIFIIIKKYTKTISELSRFILVPNFLVNYSYGNLSETLLEISFDDELKDIIVFAVPYSNQEDIFSAALLAHELGHYIIKKNSKKNKESKGKTENIKQTPNKASGTSDSIDRKITERIDSWREEFASDLIGLKFFGLSFFFAFVEYIFLDDPFETGSKDYPPYWLRLDFLIKAINIEDGIYKDIQNQIDKLNIDSQNYGQKIKDLIDFLAEKIAEIEILVAEKETKENKQAIETIKKKNLYNQINAEVNNILNSNGKYKSLIYDYNENNIQEIIKLIKLLNEYITPSEIIIEANKSGNFLFIPAGIMNILNAGWFYLIINLKKHFEIFGIDKIEDFDEKENEKRVIRQKLNELVLKAIESSHIKSKFMELTKNE